MIYREVYPVASLAVLPDKDQNELSEEHKK